MKRMWIAGIVLVLACSAALLAGCDSRPEKNNATNPQSTGLAPTGAASADTEDGARVDRSDADAPKEIRSKQIIAFDCWFSTLDLAEPGALGNHIYQLQARLENGAVKGSYRLRDTDEERSFRADHSFLNEVYELVDRNEVAQLNGHNVEVGGLPGEYGVDLDIRFASGERILVNDNQDCILPYSFMNEALKLFERGAAVTPVVLDMEVRTHAEYHEVGDGWGEVTVPVYSLGYHTADGEQVLPDGYDGLKDAIAAIDADLLNGVDPAWARFGKASRGDEFYCRTEAFVTRADSEVVSFYERTERMEDAGQENVMTEVVTHNLNAKTGKELTFSDVFRDGEYLPGLLLMAFEEAYPDETFYDEALDFIRQSVESGDGNIRFALGYGFVHLFADEYVLCDRPGALHTTLSYVLNPDQVRAIYTTAPWRWMVPLDYDTTYWREHVSRGFRLRCDEEPESEGVRWEADVVGGSNARPYTESFYGYAPDCWLVHAYDRDWVYLRVPAGDVSLYTQIYEVGERSLSRRTYEAIPMALKKESPMNPDRMRWSLDAMVITETMRLFPTGWYKADAGGLPELIGGVYDVEGPWVALRESGRYNPDKRENAAVSGGMWTLIAGEKLRPWQTDMESFLDFITADERVVRFTIDRWDGEMQLDNFGTLDDVFVPDSEGVG